MPHLEGETARIRAAYLDLMRDSLIGRLNEDPPLQSCKVDRYKAENREEGWDWPSKAPSMIGAKRMENVRRECERVIHAGVPGDFMETGVWRGGACIMMRAVLNAYGIIDRRVIAADSFAGFPRPTEGIAIDAAFDFHTYADFAVSVEEVKAAFARYGLLDEQVIFVKGLFADTLPAAPVDRLALLRLDGDMYGSTMEGLVNLYHKVSRGGTLIADDYFLFESQRNAIDEFRAAHAIADPIMRIDQYGGYWIKS
jgi:hypothetical protein